MKADQYPERVDSLWLGAHLATMARPPGNPDRPDGQDRGEPYGAIRNGALAVTGSSLAWVGRSADLPKGARARAGEVRDLGGGWVTPGLVDCHTHLVYAGDRAAEFELRLKGATYAQIAAQGGGILSTVVATRAASAQELLEESGRRLESMIAEGATTVEIKSGYGLDLATELKMLEVIRSLSRRYPVNLHPTFLGAHALPPEYKNRSDDYVDLVCSEMLPAVAGSGLATAVDAFCETIGFSLDQTRRIFQAARGLNLPVKLHAEQLSDLGGAALAAEYGALSADHLEYLSWGGVRALARSGTTAVLLPGAFYFLGEKKLPPVDGLRAQGVNLALATDSNPGSSPTTSPLLILNMACTLFRLTPEEALAGMTRNGALALGVEDQKGALEPGKAADFVVWSISRPAELAYYFGFNPCRLVVRGGKVIHERQSW